MCGQALKITSLGGCDWVSSHSNIRSYIFQPPQSGRKPMVRCNAKLEKKQRGSLWRCCKYVLGGPEIIPGRSDKWSL